MNRRERRVGEGREGTWIPAREERETGAFLRSLSLSAAAFAAVVFAASSPFPPFPAIAPPPPLPLPLPLSLALVVRLPRVRSLSPSLSPFLAVEFMSVWEERAEVLEGNFRGRRGGFGRISNSTARRGINFEEDFRRRRRRRGWEIKGDVKGRERGPC